MKLPRDVSGKALVQALARLGCQITRQRGSHVRLTTKQLGEHHVTAPMHDALRVGALSAILNEIAAHFQIERNEVLVRLFGPSSASPKVHP